MTLYLLDTNVVSDLLRFPHGPAARRVRVAGSASICTSVVVAAELRFGAEKRGSSRLARLVEEMLALLDIRPLTPPADATYAQIRAGLEGRGTPIGANDLLIAAHARTLGCTLVTDNEREFSRVPGLPVENWLRPAPSL